MEASVLVCQFESTMTSALEWASQFKDLGQSFFSDGQGAIRGANLYRDLSCFEFNADCRGQARDLNTGIEFS